jgi:hypothetical protein
MASNKQPDPESQKLAPSSAVIVAATTVPPSNHSGKIASDSIAVGINDEHDSEAAPLLPNGNKEDGVWADDEMTRQERMSSGCLVSLLKCCSMYHCCDIPGRALFTFSECLCIQLQK